MSRGNLGKPNDVNVLEPSAETPRRLFLALAAAEHRERQLFKVIDWTAYEDTAKRPWDSRLVPTVPSSGRRAVVSFAVIAVGASVVAVPALSHRKHVDAGLPARATAMLSDGTPLAADDSVTRSDGVEVESSPAAGSVFCARFAAIRVPSQPSISARSPLRLGFGAAPDFQPVASPPGTGGCCG